MPKLLNIKKSPNPKKKWRAEFLMESGRIRHTDFGASGMDDYLHTGDKEQRKRYRERHKKDMETGDPTRAGYLSMFILWGDSQSFEKNLAAYKRRFGV
jgi:hypothetical protein